MSYPLDLVLEVCPGGLPRNIAQLARMELPHQLSLAISRVVLICA